MNLLLRWQPTATRFLAATVILVPTSLAAAYAILYWTRGIALPLLLLVAFWFTLLRPMGPLTPGECVAAKAWAVATGFFLIGPLVLPVFRLALLALATLVAFQPARAP
jgi:hypothetical protein